MTVALWVMAAAVITAVIIRNDARKRGKNHLFWTIFSLLLFGVCAVPVYCYSIRRQKKRSGNSEFPNEGQYPSSLK